MRLIRSPLPITERFKLIRRISSQAIKEIKSGNSVDELINKHMVNGVCSKCSKDTQIIKSVGLCLNCSINPKSFGMMNKKMTRGVCSCGFSGLVDKEFHECPSCYTKNGRGVKQ